MSTTPDNQDIGIIFLSGAGLQGWIWDNVRERIAAPTKHPGDKKWHFAGNKPARKSV